MIQKAKLSEKRNVNKNLRKKKELKELINENNFRKEQLVGKGGFGQVWKVKSKINDKIYALKEIPKIGISNKKDFDSLKSERDIMAKLGNNFFLVNLLSSYHDDDNFCYVMDFLEGGDLNFYIDHEYKFTENQLKFFIGCAVLALEHMHKNNIIHKDIKLDNFLFDENGYLHLTDFGLSEIYEKENAKMNGGTYVYMSPEILMKENHEFSVDFYSLGILLYFINFLEFPYEGENRKSILKQMNLRQNYKKNKDLNQKIKQLSENYPISEQQKDFILKLLEFNPSKRLGYNGIEEIKGHPWFKGFNWKDLAERKIKAPFKPKLKDNIDYDEIRENLTEENEDELKEKIARHLLFCDTINSNALFNEFIFINKSLVPNNKIIKPNKKNLRYQRTKVNKKTLIKYANFIQLHYTKILNMIRNKILNKFTKIKIKKNINKIFSLKDNGKYYAIYNLRMLRL